MTGFTDTNGQGSSPFYLKVLSLLQTQARLAAEEMSVMLEKKCAKLNDSKVCEMFLNSSYSYWYDKFQAKF